MKIFLIHGEDNIKSKERLLKFINEANKRNWEVVYLDDSNTGMIESFSFSSLFQKERFFIHRDLKSILKRDFDWINKNSDKYFGNLVLYSNTEVTKTLISKLPKSTKVEEFKLPKLIWKLLDSFYPGNAKIFINMLHKLTEKEPIERVFYLLSTLLRDLYWAKEDPKSMKYPEWRIGKLKVQSSKFRGNLLENIINDMSVADIKSKTSNFSLDSLLDFAVITKIE